MMDKKPNDEQERQQQQQQKLHNHQRRKQLQLRRRIFTCRANNSTTTTTTTTDNNSNNNNNILLKTQYSSIHLNVKYLFKCISLIIIIILLHVTLSSTTDLFTGRSIPRLRLQKNNGQGGGERAEEVAITAAATTDNDDMNKQLIKKDGLTFSPKNSDNHATSTSGTTTTTAITTHPPYNCENDDDYENMKPWTTQNLLSAIHANCTTIQRISFEDDDIIGEIHPPFGQLIVNIENRTDYLLWDRCQTSLCQLLQNMSMIDTIPASYYPPMPKRPLLNMTLDCQGMTNIHSHQYKFLNMNGIGEGNWVTAIYTTRITAAAARVDFQFQCWGQGKELQSSKLTSVLPWLEVYQPSPSEDNPWPYKGRLPTKLQTCSVHFRDHRVDYMIDEIMHDMQRMGVTIMGSNSDLGRVHPDVPIDQPPLVSGVEVEDVVIHFRCGDVFGGVNRADFGIIKFKEYTKRISKDAKTVGIVTQPFTVEGNRKADVDKIQHCSKAVHLMIDYLQEHLPSAKISLHNGPEDTLPLTYARLIMANQSFTSLTSFGIYPVIGGFGKGYFQKGTDGVNHFNIHLPKMYPEKLHMMTAPFLSSGSIRNKEVGEVLKWLVDDSDEK